MSEEIKKKTEEATSEQVVQEPSDQAELLNKDLDQVAGGRAITQNGIKS